MKKISIIVPCYNEEEALPFFYPVAHEVLEKLPDDYELIFVNDGSKDKTLEILRDLAAMTSSSAPLFQEPVWLT